MSKKALTILILFILIIVGISGFLYLLLVNKPTVTVTDSHNPSSSTDLFPFGNPTPVVSPDLQQSSSTPTSYVDQPITVPKLQHITLEPIAGAMASTTASTTNIRYVDRGTGHIIDRKLDNLAIVTVSNTTIPKVYEAVFNTNGNDLLLRYLTDDNSISTFSAELRSQTQTSSTTALETTPFKIIGSYLPIDIKNIAISPKTTRIASLTTASNATVSISTLSDTSKKGIWSSPLLHWQLEWPEENTLSLTTAPSALGIGYNYFINTTSGKVTQTLGPVQGLTTLTNKNVTKIFYSESSGNSVSSKIFTVKSATTSEATYKTLPEKCVWSTLNTNILYCAIPIEIPSALYPDDWYKGKISFTDQLWSIDTESGDVALLANLYKETGEVIDAVNLTLDNKEQVLLFTNKKDLTLWALDLTQI